MPLPILSISLFFMFNLIFTSPSASQSLCPGATNCMEGQVFCSYADLDDFSCELTADTNDIFPTEALCAGVGVPNNLQWWSFVGRGGPISMSFSFDTMLCDFGFGGQAGIFIRDCSGTEVLDCNANCNSPSFTLSGLTECGQIYYLWVDGCLGAACPFSINVQPSSPAPQLPDTIQRPLIFFNPSNCIKPIISVSSLHDLCEIRQSWTVNGQPYSSAGIYGKVEYELDFSGYDIADSVELCLTLSVGGPDSANICDQVSECWVFRTPIRHITKIDTFICSDDAVVIDGSTYTGVICDSVVNVAGTAACDSLLNITIRRPSFSANWTLDTQSMVLCHGIEKLPVCGLIDMMPFQVRWLLDGSEIAILPGNACAHISEEGEYTIEILYEDNGNLCETGISFSQEVEFKITTSVPGVDAERVAIFPNPAHSEIQIASEQEIRDWRILNSGGQSILNGRLINTTIDIKDLKPGIYFFRASTSEGRSMVGKFIKINE